MSRAKRLAIVLDMAEDAEQKAAQALEQSRTQKERDQTRLNELIQYCEDYELSFRRPQPQLRAEELQRQRGFLVQLNDARDQQERIVEQRTRVFEQKQRLWQSAHLKKKAMSDLIARLKEDEAKVLSKKEEKMLDEWFNQTSSQRVHNPVF